MKFNKPKDKTYTSTEDVLFYFAVAFILIYSIGAMW